MQIRLYSFVLLAMIFSLRGRAQDFNDDARLWLYIKLDKKINEHWEAHLMLQNRFENNISQYSRGYADFGFSYFVNKQVRFIADYVYGSKQMYNGTYSRIHQLYAGIILKKHVNSFVFTYRNLVQGQVKNIYSSENGAVPAFYDRNKLTVKYELNKRWEFFVAEELNIPFYRYEDYYISRSRSFVGAFYNLSRHSSLEAYFMFQRKLNDKPHPSRDFVYGLTYSHSF